MIELEKLKADKETLTKELEQAQQVAVMSNPNCQRYIGALSYIDGLIKVLESEGKPDGDKDK